MQYGISSVWSESFLSCYGFHCTIQLRKQRRGNICCEVQNPSKRGKKKTTEQFCPRIGPKEQYLMSAAGEQSVMCNCSWWVLLLTSVSGQAAAYTLSWPLSVADMLRARAMGMWGEKSRGERFTNRCFTIQLTKGSKDIFKRANVSCISLCISGRKIQFQAIGLILEHA